ncbi:MAG: penicillin-binding transpeptidase domain-containing protein, partial [Verrucomicrobiota bacterium]
VRETAYDPPEAGDDIYLTIDAEIQFVVENVMRQVGRGAASVMDVNTGEILALVSVPSFDPNKFIPSISHKKWNQYNQDPTSPMINRAVSGYAPGSIFKVPVSFAGVYKDIVNKGQFCAGEITYGKKDKMKCHRLSGHKHTTMRDALKNSCNCFYYKYGNEAGINDVVKAVRLFGLGQKTGIKLDGEAAGTLPSPVWLQMNYPTRKWTEATTANVSIGQGYVLTSPLQMANVAATMANGGICYRPRLIHRVLRKDREPVLETKPIVQHNLLENGITKEDVDLVRKGMWMVVNDGGTGKSAWMKKMELAGKTGTAQFKTYRDTGEGRKLVKDNHVWFMAFGPFEEPKYAVCVLVQGGEAGGKVAAPLARRIFDEIYPKPDVSLVALREARGDFDWIYSIEQGGEKLVREEFVVPSPEDEEVDVTRALDPEDVPIVENEEQRSGEVEAPTLRGTDGNQQGGNE